MKKKILKKPMFIHLFLIGVFTLLTGNLLAQKSSIELEDSGYGQSKFKKASKKAYIAQFRVMYQLLFSQTETVEAGSIVGGGYRSEAKAGLTMAIQGIQNTDLIEITDNLYHHYVSELKNSGYEVITVDEAGKSSELEGWERKTGGTLNEAQFPGYIVSIPSGFDYYVKGTKASGKEKATFTETSYKLSPDLDNAVIIKVNIVVPFVVDAESGASKTVSKLSGQVAKIVMKPYLRIEKEIVASSGTFSSEMAQSKIVYTFAERKIAADAISNYTLKSNIEVPGVFEDKKYSAAAVSSVDWDPIQIGALTIFDVNDQYLSSTQPIPCEALVYKEGVSKAAQQYLTASLNEFLSNANK